MKRIPIPAFTEDAPDSKSYLRSKDNWVEFKPTAEPPVGADKVYGRRTAAGGVGSWIEIDTDKTFDTYSLKTSTITTNTVINVVNQQCYTVTATASRSLTLSDGPVGRMVTAVFVLKGTVAPIFPGAKVKWNNGLPLEMGPTKTVVTALWDGEEWILTKGASY